MCESRSLLNFLMELYSIPCGRGRPQVVKGFASLIERWSHEAATGIDSACCNTVAYLEHFQGDRFKYVCSSCREYCDTVALEYEGEKWLLQRIMEYILQRLKHVGDSYDNTSK